ncbi:TlpA disulfide reductase family protein [Granulicella sp. dw_53]|uniref:TlpA family protein disulfide reductase n=1 Tax=Granulicella sp. dw_53 TaxID=2719792 RepID=UPI001BD2506B|nr:TlpA disulfide reductase family protein [Granulicella sp. dw_53]
MAEAVKDARGSRRGAFAFVGAAVLVLAILAMPWQRRSEPLITVSQRRVLPDVALTQLDGGTWRLTEHRGQVVLINYWASWCGPCRTETPGLVRLEEEMQPKLAVVGISMDVGGKEPVREFVRRMHVGYPIAFPEPMSQMATGMAGIPTTILVDRQGRVAKTYVGETKEREFRADVERLLGEGF